LRRNYLGGIPLLSSTFTHTDFSGRRLTGTTGRSMVARQLSL
jgi:hypothetical protein